MNKEETEIYKTEKCHTALEEAEKISSAYGGCNCGRRWEISYRWWLHLCLGHGQ